MSGSALALDRCPAGGYYPSREGRCFNLLLSRRRRIGSSLSLLVVTKKSPGLYPLLSAEDLCTLKNSKGIPPAHSAERAGLSASLILQARA